MAKQIDGSEAVELQGAAALSRIFKGWTPQLGRQVFTMSHVRLICWPWPDVIM